jgi:two-component system response regulator AtoC
MIQAANGREGLRILLVDDEPALRHTVSRILAEEGHIVQCASDGADAIAKSGEFDPALIITDLRMPRMDGFAFLEKYQSDGGAAPVIVMTAYGDVDTAMEALNRGAYDYLGKPFRAEEVVLVVSKAIERERLRARVLTLERQLGAMSNGGSIVGDSGALRGVIALARKVARYPSTVLLHGESGTGKELMARLIHDESPRSNGPFIAVNCGAIPESLLESELFGHVAGAFSGAIADRAGLFVEADGGTLLLDEIGELPALLQVKLLRALQENEVRAVGGTGTRQVNLRVLAATNRDLAVEVAAHRFREDLFYRLNVVSITLPPLRERAEDIPALVRFFVDRNASRLGMEPTAASPRALAALAAYHWPGNVRELENAVERAMLLAGGETIEADHLPDAILNRVAPHVAVSNANLSVKQRLPALERELIEAALLRTGGNRTRAARMLELSHRALLYKIREYGIGM